LVNDGFEVLKRAWLHVRRNRYLWPVAFVMALAGGGAQGFSLWAQSPIPRGLTSANPTHKIGAMICDIAHGNVALEAMFIIAGVLMGIAVLATGAFAQAAAIDAVSDIENERPSGLKNALRRAREYFPQIFALTLGYLLVLAAFAAPLSLFWRFTGKKGFVFPCFGALILCVGFIVVLILAGIMFELTARYLVLEGKSMRESVRLAVALFKDYSRDMLVAWLYAMAITFMGAITMVILITVLATPLSWVFTVADRHHNVIFVALSASSFAIAWAIASATAGVFSITASSLWTLVFIDMLRK